VEGLTGAPAKDAQRLRTRPDAQPDEK
jgi:hypothetical protein